MDSLILTPASTMTSNSPIFQLHVMDSATTIPLVFPGIYRIFQLHVMDSTALKTRTRVQLPRHFQLHVMDSRAVGGRLGGQD